MFCLYRARMRSSLILAGLFVLGALPACSSSPDPQVAPPVVTLPPTSAAPSLSGEPSVEASPSAFTAPAEMKVKAVFKFTSADGDKLSVQVIAHKSVDDVEGVDAKVCNVGTTTFTVSRRPWVLLYDGGESEHDIDISGGGLPAPAYPDVDPKTLTAGKCARGWINFTAVKGKKPYGAAYKVDNIPVVWKF